MVVSRVPNPDAAFKQMDLVSHTKMRRTTCTPPPAASPSEPGRSYRREPSGFDLRAQRHRPEKPAEVIQASGNNHALQQAVGRDRIHTPGPQQHSAVQSLLIDFVLVVFV